MISLLLRTVALLLFLLGGLNQVLFGQPQLDLISFGLAAWVLAILLSGYGPSWPGRQPS